MCTDGSMNASCSMLLLKIRLRLIKLTKPAILPRWARRPGPVTVSDKAVGQFAGTVSTGVCGVTPVSASEKKIIRNVNTRLEAGSLSEIQYQVPR